MVPRPYCQSTAATDAGRVHGDVPPPGGEGASTPGEIVYSSWRRMRETHETDPDTCAYNDLALVRVDPADVGEVNASVRFWGGPTGLGSDTKALDAVYSYGNSSLRAGLELPACGRRLRR